MYFHILLNASLRFFLLLFLVLKKAVANKWLNGTTEVVRDIKHHYTIIHFCLVTVYFLQYSKSQLKNPIGFLSREAMWCKLLGWLTKTLLKHSIPWSDYCFDFCFNSKHCCGLVPKPLISCCCLWLYGTRSGALIMHDIFHEGIVNSIIRMQTPYSAGYDFTLESGESESYPMYPSSSSASPASPHWKQPNVVLFNRPPA